MPAPSVLTDIIDKGGTVLTLIPAIWGVWLLLYARWLEWSAARLRALPRPTDEVAANQRDLTVLRRIERAKGLKDYLSLLPLWMLLMLAIGLALRAVAVFL